MSSRRPDGVTLAAFAIVCTVGGANFVAVRLSNRELPPFYGAGIRFVAASALLFAIVVATRTPLPRGREILGPLSFGLLSFFVSYALFYWGAQQVPAALGGLLFGTVPLTTFVLSVAQRIERFRLRGLIGAAIAVAGVAVMAGSPTEDAISLPYLLAVVASTITAAQGAIVVKRFPPVHPFATNAIGMGVASVLLLCVSRATGEEWLVPQLAATRWALLFMVPLGSVGLFVLFVFVIQRWSATGASYQFVMFPPVSAVAAAIVLDEPLGWAVAAGVVLVVVGTYIGALASPTRDAVETRGT